MPWRAGVLRQADVVELCGEASCNDLSRFSLGGESAFLSDFSTTAPDIATHLATNMIPVKRATSEMLSPGKRAPRSLIQDDAILQVLRERMERGQMPLDARFLLGKEAMQRGRPCPYDELWNGIGKIPIKSGIPKLTATTNLQHFLLHCLRSQTVEIDESHPISPHGELMKRHILQCATKRVLYVYHYASRVDMLIILLSNGALANLTFLGLAQNQIGDAGISSLAETCAMGALPRLTLIYVDNPRHPRLAQVCRDRGIRLL